MDQAHAQRAMEHRFCKTEIGVYADQVTGQIWNVAIECMDHHEVIDDFDVREADDPDDWLEQFVGDSKDADEWSLEGLGGIGYDQVG